jgi:hypothetical protein
MATIECKLAMGKVSLIVCASTVRAQTVSDCFKAYNMVYAMKYLCFAPRLAQSRDQIITNPIRWVPSF